jgi:predicted transcriptional regulator
MTTLTIEVGNDVMQEVEKFAQKEERSREEIVGKAIRVYMNQKRLEEMRKWRDEHVAKYGAITEEEINEEIRLYREERETAR